MLKKLSRGQWVLIITVLFVFAVIFGGAYYLGLKSLHRTPVASVTTIKSVTPTLSPAVTQEVTPEITQEEAPSNTPTVTPKSNQVILPLHTLPLKFVSPTPTPTQALIKLQYNPQIQYQVKP